MPAPFEGCGHWWCNQLTNDMITIDNLNEIFDMVTSGQAIVIADSMLNDDHILICLSIFNTGAFLSVENVGEFNQDDSLTAQSNGEIYADADTILNLFKESESVNPFLIELM